MAKRAARTPRKSTTARPRIPAGFGTVTPYLAVEDGAGAMEFYKKAFGAKELMRQVTPDGKIMHGRLRIGDSIVLLSDLFPASVMGSPSALGVSTVLLHVYSTDVDALWSRAVEAGAKVSMPLENQFWGERYGQLVDPFGHRWSLSQTVRMSKAEKEVLRQRSMAQMAAGVHPSRVDPSP